LAAGFFYYKYVEKKVPVYFQENIGEVKFATEFQKWALKNPLQAQEMSAEILKKMDLYEELKSETNPAVVQQKIMAKRGQMSSEELKKNR